jgi:hypothetical protein
MFQVEKGEIATRLFEDMADSRSGKLDDEMTKLGLWRPGHLLEACTRHRSSSRLTSVVRSLEDEIKLSSVLVHNQVGAGLAECGEVRRPLVSGRSRGYHRFRKERSDRLPLGYEHVEAPAPRFALARHLRIRIDELAECRHRDPALA